MTTSNREMTSGAMIASQTSAGITTGEAMIAEPTTDGIMIVGMTIAR
jgi:hypothetical protein